MNSENALALPVTGEPVIPEQWGLAAIVGQLYAGANAEKLQQAIITRLGDQTQAAGAWLDLSILRRTLGDVERAEIFEREALSRSPIYRKASSATNPLRLLVFKTVGNFMANTPVEFMLEGSNVEVISVYLNNAMSDLGPVPDHDVALFAIGESPESRNVLNKCMRLFDKWPGNLLNFNVPAIIRLDRSKLWHHLIGVEDLACPWTLEFDRGELAEAPEAKIISELKGANFAYPLIVRPEGAHAGKNTNRVEAVVELSTVLGETTAERVHLSQFIDYASADRQFRKYRLALIDGVAYPSHMAISSHWMVHYLNAGMSESKAKRDEEAQWLNSFHETFAVKHKAALDRLCKTIGLDYFAIDCAETKDGALLIFEIDTAMIVHCMDVEPKYEYKKAPMQKLFNAFQGMLKEATSRPSSSRQQR